MIAITFLGATSRVTVNLGDTTIMAELPTADATELSAGSFVAPTIRPDPRWFPLRRAKIPGRERGSSADARH